MADVVLAGRYQLLDVLGEGANAVVWRALDTASGVEVALKRLRPELASVEEWSARLRREGRAIVTLRHRGECAELEVFNQGDPIPAQRLPHIFEPFHTSTERGGMGLGLYIAQQIAGAHGGRVEVRSGASGTAFTLRLPTELSH